MASNGNVPVKTSVRAKQGAERYRSMSYPKDLGPTHITLQFEDYSYSAASERIKITRRPLSQVALPLPQSLVDSYGVSMNDNQLGTLVAKGVSMLDQGLRDEGEGFFKSLFNNTNLVSDLKDAAGAATRGVARNAFIGGEDAFDLTSGTTRNPQTTLNFDGVALKQFQFNWQFAPKSTDDVAQLNKISTHIRGSMLPKYVEGSDLRALLKYPKLVVVGLSRSLQQQSYIYKFKPAFVTDFSLDFSPQGHAILAGGNPAFVNMTMSIKETNIHTADDHGGGDFADSSSMYN